MARAIVRCSLTDDYGSAGRNAAVAILEQAGFEWIGTFSFERRGGDVDDILVTLMDLLTQLGQLPGNTTLNHLWVYIDQESN